MERKCNNRARAHKKVYLHEAVQMNWNMFSGRLSQEQYEQSTFMDTINVGKPENVLTKLTFTPLTIIFRFYSGKKSFYLSFILGINI